MSSSVFADRSEISGQKRRKLHQAAGQRLAATGVAAAFAASLAILVCPASGALAALPTVQVDVVNPATNPALTSSVDDPGRTAYESTVSCSLVNSIACKGNFAAVPQGHRLVIQHISAQLQFAADPLIVDVSTKGVRTRASPRSLCHQ